MRSLVSGRKHWRTATPLCSFRRWPAAERLRSMATFRFRPPAIGVASLRAELADPACGGYPSFEGLVRNHNEGMSVRHLEYEAFEPLAVKEGERIVAEAINRFGLEHAGR